MNRPKNYKQMNRPKNAKKFEDGAQNKSDHLRFFFQMVRIKSDDKWWAQNKSDHFRFFFQMVRIKSDDKRKGENFEWLTN